jgi:hypothetical protein
MSRDHQLKVWIEKELADEFKERCAANGVSMAEQLSRLMEAETGVRCARNKNGLSLNTRKQRRNATRKIIALLNAIRDREEIYLFNIPESFHAGANYEAAEQAIDALDQAVCLLDDAF